MGKVEKTLSKAPNLLEQGLEHLKNKKFDNAIELLYLVAKDGDERAYIPLAEAYQKLGYQEKAHKNSLLVKKYWDISLKYYEKAYKASSNKDTKILSDMAYVEEKLGKEKELDATLHYATVFKSLKEDSSLEEKFFTAYRLGKLVQKSDIIPQRIQKIIEKPIIPSNPKEASLFFYEEALNMLGKPEEIKNAQLLRLAGSLCLTLSKNDTIKQDPETVTQYRDRARGYFKQVKAPKNKFSKIKLLEMEAEDFIKDIEENERENSNKENRINNSQYDQTTFSKLSEIYKKILAKRPFHKKTLMNQAKLFYEIKERSKATAVLNVLFTKYPEYTPAANLQKSFLKQEKENLEKDVSDYLKSSIEKYLIVKYQGLVLSYTIMEKDTLEIKETSKNIIDSLLNNTDFMNQYVRISKNQAAKEDLFSSFMAYVEKDGKIDFNQPDLKNKKIFEDNSTIKTPLYPLGESDFTPEEEFFFKSKYDPFVTRIIETLAQIKKMQKIYKKIM